jgi:hypothetical protein
MVLSGKVAEDGVRQQRQWIAELCSALLQLDSAWEPYAGEFATVAQDMAVIPPSPERGQMLFGRGIEFFWRRQYDAAWNAFHLAALDAPERLSYRYWQILAEIRLGRTEEATDHLVALISRSPTPTRYREVLKSLERIQGPLRSELMRLEARAIHAHGPRSPQADADRTEPASSAARPDKRQARDTHVRASSRIEDRRSDGQVSRLRPAPEPATGTPHPARLLAWLVNGERD